MSSRKALSPLLLLLALLVAPKVPDAIGKSKEDPVTRMLDELAKALAGSGSAECVVKAVPAPAGPIRVRGAGREEFEGTLELLRTEKGELVMRSRRPVPGFALYRLGKKQLARQTWAEARPDVAPLTRELLFLLGTDELLARLKNARYEMENDETVFRTELAGDFFPDTEADQRVRRDRVLRLEVRTEVDETGAIAGLRLTVVRKHPFSGVRFGGGQAPDVPEEGGRGIYELTFGEQAPSKPIRAFLAEAREALGVE